MSVIVCGLVLAPLRMTIRVFGDSGVNSSLAAVRGLLEAENSHFWALTARLVPNRVESKIWMNKVLRSGL